MFRRFSNIVVVELCPRGYVEETFPAFGDLFSPHVVVEAKTLRQTSRCVILRQYKSDHLLLIAESETKSFLLVFSAVAFPMCIFFQGAFLTNVHMSKLVQIWNIYLLFRVIGTPRVSTDIVPPTLVEE